MIKLYNTLSRKKEVFKPIVKGKAGIYSCGPTVYSYQHIGNMRSYIFSDILRRVLEYNGYKIKHIVNVTDVGHLTSDSDGGKDKIEEAAQKERKSVSEIADYYFEIFKEDLKKLNIREPSNFPKASLHIKEQIKLIKDLEKGGFTYETDDGIYFDSSKFKNYGKLAKLKVSGLKAGTRVEVGNKKNKSDFALWKFSESSGKREQEWDSPWGIGFPGWHLECSAMSMKYLGKTFDIHTGGEDHVPVHHTNEIAQSEASTGKKFVNYWLHGAFLLSKGKKVSKSKGGLYTISDLEKQGFSATSFRYLCLQTHYRKQLNFSLENLEAAKNAYDRLKRKIINLKSQKHKGVDRTSEYGKMFLEVISDDLNISKALDIFWKVIDDENFDVKKRLKLLEKFDEVLGLGIKKMKSEQLKLPREVGKLLDARAEARKNGRWEEADILRGRIRERGFIVEDKEEGQIVRKMN